MNRAVEPTILTGVVPTGAVGFRLRRSRYQRTPAKAAPRTKTVGLFDSDRGAAGSGERGAPASARRGAAPVDRPSDRARVEDLDADAPSSETSAGEAVIARVPSVAPRAHSEVVGQGWVSGSILVKRLAKVMGGVVTLRSADPGHTTFEVSLPTFNGHSAGPGQALKPRRAPGGRGSVQ